MAILCAFAIGLAAAVGALSGIAACAGLWWVVAFVAQVFRRYQQAGHPTFSRAMDNWDGSQKTRIKWALYAAWTYGVSI